MNRYFLGGFCIGMGLSLIRKQIQLDNADKIWEEAANGIQKPAEPAS